MAAKQLEEGDMAMNDCITTDYFKVPVSVMVRHLLGKWLKIWGIAMISPPLILVAIGIGLHDLRWVLIALMGVMVCLPSVMLLIFYNYALHPKTARAILPHRLVICRNEYVRIEYRDEPDRRIPPDETIQWSQIKYLRDCGAYWMLDY